MWKGSRPFWIVSFNCLDKDFKCEFEHTLDATKSEGNLDDWLDNKRSTIQWRSIFKTQEEERSYDANCDGSSDLWTKINHGMGDFSESWCQQATFV